MNLRHRSILALLVAALALAVSTTAQAHVPRGFVGVMIDGPLWPTTDPKVNLAQQFDKMVGDGVQNVRVVFDWSAAQPYPSWSDVPASQASEFTDVHGMPTNFTKLDEIVALAAARRITLLPVVLYAPGWDAAKHRSNVFPIPRQDGPYGRFMAALVERYGPRGTFWQTHHPKVPIRMWQIWNEPNLKVFWDKQPFQRSYVSLLRAAHSAIKRADPNAKVVLAGMPNYSWKQLAGIYRIHGARKLFDVVGVHPFTKQPRGVITILENVRKVMDRAGDRDKPIVADEVSWPSSLGKSDRNEFGFATTERGQAKDIAALLPMLGRERKKLRLLGFDYYTWAGIEDRNGILFDFAGLFRFKDGKFVAKPALGAFRKAALGLEGCRRKGSVATSCIKPG
jgi:polysaccharide biosynthesis protein PslG